MSCEHEGVRFCYLLREKMRTLDVYRFQALITRAFTPIVIVFIISKTVYLYHVQLTLIGLICLRTPMIGLCFCDLFSFETDSTIQTFTQYREKA